MLLPDQPGPNPHLAVSAGKGATIYLVNRDNLGQFNASGDQIVDEINGQIRMLFSTPAYFNGRIYLIPNSDIPMAFDLVNGRFASNTPSSQGSIIFAYPGATPVVSANGTLDAILWAIEDNSNGIAVLHAFDPNNLATEFYNSEQNSARDRAGDYVKFVPPTVVNGKVYVSTASQLSTYALIGSPTPTPTASSTPSATATSTSTPAPTPTPSAVVTVFKTAKPSIKPKHSIPGGSFRLNTTGGVTVTSVTITFSDPSLFAKARLTATSHGTQRSATVSGSSSTETFSLNRPLPIKAGKSAQFSLNLKGAATMTSGATSSQAVTAVSAGSAVVGGLPASLGSVTSDVKQ